MSNNKTKKIFTVNELYKICSSGKHFYSENIDDDKYKKLLDLGYMSEFENDVMKAIEFFKNDFNEFPKANEYENEEEFWYERDNYIKNLSFKIAEYLEEYWNRE